MPRRWNFYALKGSRIDVSETEGFNMAAESKSSDYTDYCVCTRCSKVATGLQFVAFCQGKHVEDFFCDCGAAYRKADEGEIILFNGIGYAPQD